MDKQQFSKLQFEAMTQMNSENYSGALDTTRKILGLGSNYLVSYVASGLLIDLGVVLDDEKITKEGVDLLKKDFPKIAQNKDLVTTANYNYANGFYALFSFKKNKKPFAGCFKETELDKAKFYFKEALNQEIQDPCLKSQIYVNLGNCYDELGRIVEAQEYYDMALKWNPNHGMALGNKGQGLFNYAKLSGEHQGTFLIEAYSLLSRALESGVTPEAKTSFAQYLRIIRKYFPDQRVLEIQKKYPGYKIETTSNFEKYLIEFCLEQKLYLSVCNFCQKCDAAIGDSIVIKKMLVKKTKNMNTDPFLKLSGYLNNIKQDFVSARFLLILSKYKGLNLDFVDNNVTLIDSLDQSRHNIYIQLLKEAFKSFYNILDKIAVFINFYLELGIPDDKISFHKIWYPPQKTRVIRDKIENTKNMGLNALFDIHRDFQTGRPSEKLRKTRNALTHRFVNIKISPKVENDENMTEGTLFNRTIELAQIVRSAIIYLLCFVNVEETKKAQKTIGQIGSLTAREIPKNHKKRI